MDINTKAHAVFEDLESSKYISTTVNVWKYVFYRIPNSFISKEQWKWNCSHGKHADVGFTFCLDFQGRHNEGLFLSLSFCSLTVNVSSHYTRLILYSTSSCVSLHWQRSNRNTVSTMQNLHNFISCYIYLKWLNIFTHSHVDLNPSDFFLCIKLHFGVSGLKWQHGS